MGLRPTAVPGSSSRWPRRAARLAGLCSVLTVTGVSGAAPSFAATQTFKFTTQGCHTWSVPAGVSSVGLKARASAGQSLASPGGTGDVVTGTLSGLQSGDRLSVCVGIGGGGSSPAQVRGGFGGGAASITLFPASGLARLVLVAGGGGGATNVASGGNAGYPSGTAGATFGNSLAGGGGGGGTQTSGGAGGHEAGNNVNGVMYCTAGVPARPPCTNGTAGGPYTTQGAIGGMGGYGPASGGGGGAGYYGGGGGGGGDLFGGAGGGGSDYFAPALALPQVLTGCARTGTTTTYGTGAVVLTTP